MRKKITGLATAILFGLLAVEAQEIPDVKLPSVLPPSPEAAAITKGGSISTGLFSGVAQASIPIYEIKMKGFSIPVSLNYASGGMKLDEIPSRVGMGWVLAPSGVITRVVHGLPDENTYRQQPPSDFIWTNQANFDYLYTTSNTAPAYETQPDEFRFEAPGLSGKFIVKDDGSILQIPYSNLKIQVFGGPGNGGGAYSSMIITNTEGVKYRFGGYGAYENTISHSNFHGIHGIQNIRTGFFLKEINLPDGQTFTFNYSSTISFTTLPGVSHTYTRPVQNPNGLEECPNVAALKCPVYYGNAGTFAENLNQVTYHTVVLTGISTSDNQEVSFSYANRPDGAGDKRYTAININAGGYQKAYSIVYHDPPDNITTNSANGGGSYNKRFFLKDVYSLAERTAQPGTYDTIRYRMTYDDPNVLPQRLSFAQDEFGYYNGKTSNYTLLPAYVDGFTNYWVSADRRPDSIFASKGMLKKITFPTGGYEQFQYECNTYGNPTSANTISSQQAIGSGTTDEYGYAQPVVHYSAVIPCRKNQSGTLNYSVFQNPGCSTYCTQPPAGQANYAKVEVEDLSNGQFIYTNILMSNVAYNAVPLTLLEGRDYRIKLTAYGEPNAGWAEVKYDTMSSQENPPMTFNKRPGVRVKKIETYDPVTNKTTNRHFKYTSLNNLTGGSGQPILSGTFLSEYFYSKFCSPPDPGQNTCWGCKIVCQFRVIGSNSTLPLYQLEGNETGYASVIESDDPSFTNGGIEHHYTYMPSTNHVLMMGGDIPGLSTSCITTLNGYEIATNIFNSSLSYVKKDTNYFRIDTAVNNTYRSIAVRRRFEPTIQTPVGGDMFDVFDVMKYTFVSNWIKNDSTVSRQWDANGVVMKNKTVYYYGSSANILPVKVETTNSRNETISIETAYPTHYSSTAPYDAMVGMNIISTPVTVVQNKGVAQVKKVQTNYVQWHAGTNTAVFEPGTMVTQMDSYSLYETRLRYHKYDEKGHPLEVSKENDLRISYLWNYDKTFPVAEFQNASLSNDSIAYTSFETTDRGGWETPGLWIETDATAPTGEKIGNLQEGYISKTILSSKSYYVTYWSRSGTVSVNSTSAQLLMTKGNWSCYRHTISGASQITITGTAAIDELRLYPVDALMKTQAFKPFVGVTAECDANNRIIYYEYDVERRLSLVRDGDRNILKKICYTYSGQVDNCPIDVSSNATWTATGQSRCQTCPANPAYLSGITEIEQIDVNTNSPTYNKKRWIPTTGGSCVAAPHWVNTGTTSCEQNSNGENTGYQVIIQQDINPCSASYLSYQQITQYNTSACPVCSPACNYPQQKCINGTCMNGTWSVVKVVQINQNTWECTYAYCYPNGTSSTYRQTVTSNQPCQVTCGGSGMGGL